MSCQFFNLIADSTELKSVCSLNHLFEALPWYQLATSTRSPLGWSGLYLVRLLTLLFGERQTSKQVANFSMCNPHNHATYLYIIVQRLPIL